MVISAYITCKYYPRDHIRVQTAKIRSPMEFAVDMV